MEHFFVGEVMPWLLPAGSLITLFILVIKTNKDNEARVSRVYERLDEVKKDAECKREAIKKEAEERRERLAVSQDLKFVDKDICSILHMQLGKDIAEIKETLKEILQEQKNGKSK